MRPEVLQQSNEILEAYQSGKKIDAITAQFRISVQTLYKLIDDNNIPRRCKDRLLSPSEQEILRLMQSGKTVVQIAEIRCRSAATVYVQISRLKAKLGLDTHAELLAYQNPKIQKLNAVLAKLFFTTQLMSAAICVHRNQLSKSP